VGQNARSAKPCLHYIQLKKTAPNRLFVSPLEGVICRNCGAVFKFRSWFPVTLVWFVLLVPAVIFLLLGLFSILVFIDDRLGGLFVTDNGRGNFLSWLLSLFPFSLTAAVIDARLRGTTEIHDVAEKKHPVPDYFESD
jgi:hypothetical protein